VLTGSGAPPQARQRSLDVAQVAQSIPVQQRLPIDVDIYRLRGAYGGAGPSATKQSARLLALPSPDISPGHPPSLADPHQHTLWVHHLIGTLWLRGYAVCGPLWTAISGMPALPIE